LPSVRFCIVAYTFFLYILLSARPLRILQPRLLNKSPDVQQVVRPTLSL